MKTTHFIALLFLAAVGSVTLAALMGLRFFCLRGLAMCTEYQIHEFYEDKSAVE